MTFTKEDVINVIQTLDLDSTNERFSTRESESFCRYSTEDCTAPSCIIGQIIYRLDKELFAEIADEERAWGSLQVYGGPRERFERDADDFMCALQSRADRQVKGRTWREALRLTEEWLDGGR